MPQLFCLNEPKAKVVWPPSIVRPEALSARLGRCGGYGQPPLGAACDGRAGTASRPAARAAHVTILRSIESPGSTTWRAAYSTRQRRR